MLCHLLGLMYKTGAKKDEQRKERQALLEKAESRLAYIQTFNPSEAPAAPARPAEHAEEAHICPISHEPMHDPVVTADGHTYEREAITVWLQTSTLSPLTGLPLRHRELVPNHYVRGIIAS